MTQAKRRPRALSLMLLSIVGSLVLVVTDAEAITWDAGGSELTGNVTVLGETTGFSSMLVPAQNLVVQCAFGPVTGFLFFLPNTAHVTFNPLGCTTFIKGVENKNCSPNILFVNAKVKPILHSGKVYLLAEALTAGASLTTFHYNEETCALPPLPSVKGTVVLECFTGALVAADCKTGRVKQLVRPVAEGLFADGLVYGLNLATVHGEGEAYLGAPSFGIAWNALI